ncbi:MAG: tetratricopeptide repeat protein [Pseudomonadota bacterium]
MNKWWIPAVTALALLNGCTSVPQGSIPVVDSGVPVSNSERVSAQRTTNNYPQASASRAAQSQSITEDSGVVVMIPGGGAAVSTPISSAPFTPGPITPGPAAAPISTGSYTPSSTYSAPAPITPSGIPSNSAGLAADEQLDGPVLALLTTAQQQQSSGDLNGASSSLERAQRVAPREPQVLYRLAQVRMAQGDAAQAEQFARRGLTFASGRPDLQASLWGLIAQAREKQGDAAGAALARQKAKVSL